MSRFLFKSRWIALAWLLATVFSIGAFFSEGGGHESLGETADDIRELSGSRKADVARGSVDDSWFYEYPTPPDEAELAAEAKAQSLAELGLAEPRNGGKPKKAGDEDEEALLLDTAGTE